MYLSLPLYTYAYTNMYIYIYERERYIHTYIHTYLYLAPAPKRRDVEDVPSRGNYGGPQGMRVASNNWLDRALLSTLYMFKPSRFPMFNPLPWDPPASIHCWESKAAEHSLVSA